MPRKRGEFTTVFYGIHSGSLKVQQVWLTRGGTLSRSNENGSTTTSTVLPGRRAQSEVVIVFDLTSIVSIPAHLVGSEIAKEIEQRLETKAAQLRAERDGRA